MLRLLKLAIAISTISLISGNPVEPPHAPASHEHTTPVAEEEITDIAAAKPHDGDGDGNEISGGLDLN